jgi:hypothetical protein
MKPTSFSIRALALAGLTVLVVWLTLGGHVSRPLPMKPLTAQTFVGVIAWLVAIALFVERANEVVVMFFRDEKADRLDRVEARMAELARTKSAAAEALALNTGATPAERSVAAQDAETARQKLADAQEAKALYRSGTREIALLVGFFFGVLSSVAGVRGFQGLLQDNTPQDGLFTVCDILVTSAMLAGGSEGIHRLANVYTSFMDGLSTQIDQKTKNQTQTTKP